MFQCRIFLIICNYIHSGFPSFDQHISLCVGALQPVDALVHIFKDAEQFFRAVSNALSALKTRQNMSARGRYPMSPLLWHYMNLILGKYIAIGVDTTQVDVRRIHTSSGGVTSAYFRNSRDVLKLADLGQLSVLAGLNWNLQPKTRERNLPNLRGLGFSTLLTGVEGCLEIRFNRIMSSTSLKAKVLSHGVITSVAAFFNNITCCCSVG